MTPIVFLSLFALVSLAHLAGHQFGIPKLRYATKPLIVPLLGLFYLFSAAPPSGLVLAALACDWLGDVILMLPDPAKTRRPLKLGIAAFLAGHLFYIATFVSYASSGRAIPFTSLLLCLPYLAMGVIAARLLHGAAKAMPLPIYSYIIVITAMGSSTVLSLGTVESARSAFLIAGAALFMFSDVYNSFARLVHRLPREGVIVMSTYILGQFLIVKGCIPL